MCVVIFFCFLAKCRVQINSAALSVFLGCFSLFQPRMVKKTTKMAGKRRNACARDLARAKARKVKQKRVGRGVKRLIKVVQALKDTPVPRKSRTKISAARVSAVMPPEGRQTVRQTWRTMLKIGLNNQKQLKKGFKVKNEAGSGPNSSQRASQGW